MTGWTDKTEMPQELFATIEDQARKYAGQHNDPDVRVALERDIAAVLADHARPIRHDHPALAERVQFRWSLNDTPRNRHERRAAKARSRQR